jgi:hypothetical protein
VVAGTIISNVGGYGPAAMAVSTIYIVGILATPFLRETRGQPLPETL